MRKWAGIGEAELELLQFIASNGPTTSRQATDYFAEQKGYTRSTIGRMLDRLCNKGYLDKQTVEGVFHYSSQQPPEDLNKSLVKAFVDKKLRGSVQPLVSYLADSKDLSDQELDELKRLVDDLAKRKKEKSK